MSLRKGISYLQSRGNYARQMRDRITEDDFLPPTSPASSEESLPPGTEEQLQNLKGEASYDRVDAGLAVLEKFIQTLPTEKANEARNHMNAIRELVSRSQQQSPSSAALPETAMQGGMS